MDASLQAASVHTYRFCSRGIMIMYIFILLCINFVATHAGLLAPELYWKSMLPTAPIPKSIAVLLHPTGEGTAVHGGFKKPERQGTCQITYCYYGMGRAHHSETKLQDKPNTSDLFFLERDLKFGHKMKFPFEETSNQASFLPRQVLKSIPFSSTKMAEILNKFDVKPGSIEAGVMKSTIQECEEPGTKGEDKYCATSLESMIDFTILKLGRHVEAFSTDVMMKTNETKKQEYKITNGVKKVGEANLVVCHKLSYVYAVFYCHKIESAIAYMVSLEGADGSIVNAVSVCHTDTSKWNPNHVAFQMLKVKPGSVPICHFLFQDSVAWVPKQN